MDHIDIMLVGCSGRMGKAISGLLPDNKNTRIVCGLDMENSEIRSFPVYKSFDDISERPDVIIDVSHHSLISDILDYSRKNRIPLVICTTGHSEDELNAIREASDLIPVLQSRNMSFGINLLCELVRMSASVLGEDFDIEILESHHSKKLDAPSGTALMLADAARESRGGLKNIYDRSGIRKEREHSEIGIQSIRGGTVVGEHSVFFLGDDEAVTISHSAGSRKIFAKGAVKAAEFIVNRENGLYSMKDVIDSLL